MLRVTVNPEYKQNWEAFCGFIPSFISADALSINEQYEHMSGKYGFPTSKSDGEVTKDLVYKYKGDPDLYPIATFTTPQDIVIAVYKYAFVSINKQGQESIVVRMD